MQYAGMYFSWSQSFCQVLSSGRLWVSSRQRCNTEMCASVLWKATVHNLFVNPKNERLPSNPSPHGRFHLELVQTRLLYLCWWYSPGWPRWGEPRCRGWSRLQCSHRPSNSIRTGSPRRWQTAAWCLQGGEVRGQGSGKTEFEAGFGGGRCVLGGRSALSWIIKVLMNHWVWTTDCQIIKVRRDESRSTRED